MKYKCINEAWLPSGRGQPEETMDEEHCAIRHLNVQSHSHPFKISMACRRPM